MQRGAAFHHRILEQDAVFHAGALFNTYIPKQDAVFHAALDVAAVCDQGVDAGTAGVDIAGGGVVLLAVHRPLLAEQRLPQSGIQQLHAALIVALDAVDPGGVAVVDVGVEWYFFPMSCKM